MIKSPIKSKVIDLQEQEKFQKKIDQQLDNDIKNNSTPFWLTKTFVDRPYIVLLICAFFFLLTTIITFAADLKKMSPSHNRDFLIWDNERTEHFDMYMEAQSEFLKGQQTSQIPHQTITVSDWTTFIIIKGNKESDNILNVANIKFLYKIEQYIKNLKTFENFCLKSEEDNTEGCAANSFFSITSLFADPENVTQTEIDTTLSNIANNEQMWLTFKGLFENKFSATNQTSNLLRTIFFFGGPLNIDGKSYKDIFDDSTGQDGHFDTFTEEILDYIEEENLGAPGGVRILGYSEAMADLQLQNTADSDFMWAFGSIIFVLIYMAIHLKSLFLSFMSMLSICFSFPITLCIFNGIFGITYFMSLHILVVFIVLGIAADNVFVFTDCWNQTHSYPQLTGDFQKRMAFTFRRASRAMLATSSTTAAAFLSTGLSPIMPISSFGFFAGILIPVNFLLVITFFPSVLMLNEKYVKNLCQKKNTDQNSTTSNNEVQQNNKDIEIQQNNNLALNNQQNSNNNSNVISEQPPASLNSNEIKKIQKSQVKDKELPSIVKFFDNQFNDNVFKFRYPILFAFLIWSTFAIYRAVQLPALSEPEQFLPDEHDSTQAKDAMRYDFHMSGNSDTGIKVNQFWGVKGIDKEDVGMWEPSDLGKIQWDENFDLSPKANQKYLYDLCVQMKTSSLVQDGLISCFMLDFYTFMNDQFAEPDQFITKLTEFTTDPLGIPHYNDNVIGLIQGELKYVSIELSAHGIPFSPYKELNPIFEQWDDYIKEQNKKAPAGMNKSFQTAQMGWVFMITEKAFSSSAMSGTAISIAFAFFVLLLTTHNIIITSYSIITIMGIVFSVISIMEMAGWELGVAESIAIVILIGMSVDYVVHLANHYVESVFPDRFRKMKVSLKDLGISIISGATTTIGSGIFLFFAEMVVFNKFAILIVATILFSLAYALIFFSALVHVLGPQGNQGNLLVLFQKKQKNLKPNKIVDNSQQKDKQIDIQDVNQQDKEQQQIKQEVKLDIQNDNNQNQYQQNVLAQEQNQDAQ